MLLFINIIGLMCFTGKVIIPDDVDETAVFFDLETTGLGTNLFLNLYLILCNKTLN